MLACVLAGRPVQVIAGRRGGHTWSDGYSINVDPSLDRRNAVEAVVVQAALIGAGSLSAELMRPLIRRARWRRRFLSIEGPRAVAHLRDLLPQSLTYMVRDDIAMLSNSPASSLCLARTHLAVPESGFPLGVLRPRTILAVQRHRHTAESSSGLTHRPDANAEQAETPRARDSPADTQRARDGAESPLFSSGTPTALAARLLRALLGGTAAPSADGPIGGPATSRAGAVGRGGPNTRIYRSTANELANSPSGKGFRYPEWHAHIGAYRAEWCTVRVAEPDAGRSTPDSNPVAVPDLRRPLARLGTRAQIRRRQSQGDDIDIDAVIDHQITAGSSEDADGVACYLAAVRDQRDLSALILLDASGSAAEPGVGGVRIHDHQRSAVAGLTGAMQRLGDRVAVYAFTSHGRHHVQMTALKTFAERTDRTLRTRLQQLEPRGYSRLGAAIRHGTHLLDNEGGTTRRLLIVITDGLAFDHGYDQERGTHDARRALAEARNRGVGCLCLSVGATSPPGDLGRVFGTAAHATIARPENLALVINQLCRAALRAAEVRRHH